MTANADESKSFGRFILRGVVIALALLLLLIVAFSDLAHEKAPDLAQATDTRGPGNRER